jgi:hypothetical protein
MINILDFFLFFNIFYLKKKKEDTNFDTSLIKIQISN